jgi:hypothetical protein
MVIIEIIKISLLIEWIRNIVKIDNIYSILF